MIKIQTYKVFSFLLLYPSEDLKNISSSILDVLKSDNLISSNFFDDIKFFLSFIDKNKLLYLQEYYIDIFDRQKFYSLYLFEHIHGDSRDRGMAMVDLKNLYKLSNFELKDNELPDFIPVFLEYLSLLSRDKASNLLGEIINIISVLKIRLEYINSSYSVIFSILESLSNVNPDKSLVDKILRIEKYSKIFKDSVDKKWKEPVVF